jgi:hypothetical protein
VAVVAFLPLTARSADDLESLQASMMPLGGLVEAPAGLRFIVATVPVTATFEAIEQS